MAEQIIDIRERIEKMRIKFDDDHESDISNVYNKIVHEEKKEIGNLPNEVIDASKMMGSTKMQLLFLVKIPLALPLIMLGLNQTIMYGIAMLVIAALIGTNGLEQIVFIGLTDGNMGKGLIAGISMAIIAMIVDRITKTISEKRSEALGLAIK